MAVTSKLPKPPVNDPALVPVGEHAGSPALHLDRVAIVIGSDESCRLHLVSSQISRQHALIITTADEVYVRDLCSRTQTFVNENPVREAVLKHGDLLRMGHFSFKLSDQRKKSTSPARAESVEMRLDGDTVATTADNRTILIGRRDGCDVLIDDESVSTVHSVIFEVGEKRMVRDMHSRSGTRLNDEKIHQDELLPPARLTIGNKTIDILSVATAEERASEAQAVQQPVAGEAVEIAVAEPTRPPADEPPPALAVPQEPLGEPVLEPQLDEADLSSQEPSAAGTVVMPAQQPVEPMVELTAATVHADAVEPPSAGVTATSAMEVSSEPVKAVVEAVSPETSHSPVAAPTVESEPPAALAQAVIGEELMVAEQPMESPSPRLADIPAEISVTPPAVMVEPTFTLDGVSSELDDQPLEDLSPVAPADPESFQHSDAVEPVAGFDLGMTAEEAVSVPVPLISPSEPMSPPVERMNEAPVSPAQPSELPSPVPTPAAPVAPVPRVKTVVGGMAAAWTDSFSLDDGFFGADLNAAGVMVQPQGQGLPASAPISGITSTLTDSQGTQAEEQTASLPPETGGITFSAPIGANMDLGIGGMGITLPELEPPPEDFGKVSISFGDKDLPSRPRPPASKPMDVPVEEEPQPQDVPPEKLRAGAVSKFTTVPKSLASRAGSGAFSEDAENGADAVIVPPTPPDTSRAGRAGLPKGITGPFDGVTSPEVRQKDAFSEVEPTALNDAAFGGQRLNKADDYVIPETAAGKAAVAADDIDDFAEDPFWDSTDEVDGPSPPRILLPPAPPEAGEPKEQVNADNPVADTDPITGQTQPESETALPESLARPEKSKEAQPQRAHVPLRLDLSPLRRPPPSEAFQPRGPHGEPIILRPRRKKLRIPMLVLMMLATVVVALVIVHFVVPVKSQVTGSVQFNHVDLASGSSQWENWQTGQRALLTQKSTVEAAQKIFGQLTSEANPGFLGDNRLVNLAARGRFVPASGAGMPTMLHLVYDSSDLTQDATRMMALLRAIAQANAPLTDAARRNTDELKTIDSEINIYNKQQDELKESQSSQLRIVASGPALERLSSVAQAVETQWASCAAVDQTVAHDAEHLNRLLTTVPGEVANTEPSGGLSVADDQLSQLVSQLKDLRQALSAAQAAAAQNNADSRQRVKDALDRFSQDIAAAGVAVANNAVLAKTVGSTREMLSVVQDLTVSLLADGEHLAKDTQDYKRLVGLSLSDKELLAASRELIDNENKHIAAKRKNTDDVLQRLQDQLTRLIDAAANLPVAQQDVVRKLKDRLDAYNQARRRLDSITDSAGEESEKVKALRQQMDTVTAQIGQREHEVVEATQKRLTDQQRTALANQIQAARKVLADDQAVAAQAQTAYQTALSDYFRARINRENAQQATGRLADLKIQLDQIQQKLDGLQIQRLRMAQAAGPVYEVKPVEERDVQTEQVDHRQAYSLLCVVGIAIVFSFIIMAAMRRDHDIAPPSPGEPVQKL